MLVFHPCGIGWCHILDTHLWSQAHPAAVVGPAASDETAFAGQFTATLMTSLVAFTFLFAYVAYERFRIRRTEDELTETRRLASSLEGISS